MIMFAIENKQNYKLSTSSFDRRHFHHCIQQKAEAQQQNRKRKQSNARTKKLVKGTTRETRVWLSISTLRLSHISPPACQPGIAR